MSIRGSAPDRRRASPRPERALGPTASACSIAFAPASHAASSMSRASMSGTAAPASHRSSSVPKVREDCQIAGIARSSGASRVGSGRRRAPRRRRTARRRPADPGRARRRTLPGCAAPVRPPGPGPPSPSSDRAAPALHETVGVEDDHRAGLEHHRRVGVHRPDVDAERQPAGRLEERGLPAGAGERRWMARGRQSHGIGLRVERDVCERRGQRPDVVLGAD